jgi:hypothetical protein
VFWPRDLLPQEFPDCAIYSIAYDYLTQDKAYLDINGQENHHVLALTLKLASTPVNERAPIVFIAHGLAGINVEQVTN